VTRTFTALFLALLLAVIGAPPSHAATIEQVTGFGSNPGRLQMFRYVPDGLPAGRPLVVAMHGCGQTAATIGTNTGWRQLADRIGFALLLPQQTATGNPLSCFNWFKTEHTSRDQGESLSIRQMIAKMATDQGVDPARVYVTGLSAGGAMAATLMAVYPDVIAGGGIAAGIPHRCAPQTLEWLCMNPGVDRTPAQWGDAVRAASPGGGTRTSWPVLSVWHGTNDGTVNPVNTRELVDQWTNAHRADQTPDVSDTVAGYPHKVYRDAAGRPVVESFDITGMGHAQAIDPGQCGTAGDAYIVDANICAAEHMATFWGLQGGGGNPPGGPTTLTIANNAAQDGYVKAAADGGAPAVGTLETLGLAVGRGTDGKHSRTVLSFDTSAIPDDAVITRAFLTVTRQSASGDPWTGNRLLVDVRTGCFGGCGIETSDWAASPTLPAAAEIARFTSTGTADLPATALNRTGTTQLKLRLEQAPASTAYIFVAGGTAATLTVQYAA
jgi:poly(hydroxyalkanoate) depolymerase family esterase